MVDSGRLCGKAVADRGRGAWARRLALLLGVLAHDAGAAERAADAFFERLRELCAQSFAGRVEVDRPPPTAPDPFAGKLLRMHVGSCRDDELRLPFDVGDDRSRIWVLRRSAAGLRLIHEHRHEDGSADRLTGYGGASRSGGNPSRQEFPADAESIALFRAEGRAASISNVWALEFAAEQQFVYELARPDGRLFRVVFDLRRPLAAPPPTSATSD